MTSESSMSWAFIEKVNQKNKYNKVFHIDGNKFRKNILYNSSYDYPIFTVMDEPVKYDEQEGAGIYFIMSDNYFPLRGNGWYYKPMIDYCLENNIITKENILYTVQASLTIPANYYNEFIDKCYNELPEELRKFSINSMIGAFKPNVNKQVYTKSICVTRNEGEAFNQYLKNDGNFIDVFNVNDENFYQVFSWSAISKMESEGPIYEQIIQIENIELHKLSNIIKSKNGEILDLSTDCIFCSFPENKLPFEFIKNSYDIKGYNWDNGEPKYKLERGRNDRLIVERVAKNLRNDNYNLKNNHWNIINDVDDNNFDLLIDETIKRDKGCNIDGSAGTGKSYFIKGLTKTLDEINKKNVE
jgi:hypothetical protein